MSVGKAIISKKKQKQARVRQNVYNDFRKLKQDPRNMTSAIVEVLMKKYKLRGNTTIYRIVKRVTFILRTIILKDRYISLTSI